ncbi:hypothetical protein DA718_15655 [Klebsiella huaxiensis]|uniref:Uncharacterized protein n=1 Tax=Klebsiella huaxiensis TaxID=2153354 RepID=A0ABT6ECA9_9ENTR|nr:hypothetical protein [Klebsiella huaxiensis]MDG1643060.1 hypothetical protein [Klebsiella huaxiensis]QBG08525.1 hypothetical protein DA718_15655 [Klebsiella huaxiensis]
MKTTFLLGIVFILLVFCLHPDLCLDAAHYLQEMIFLLESPVLLDGNLDGNILALNGGYPAENQSAFTSTA